MVQAGRRVYASDVNLRVGNASLTSDSTATSSTLAVESGSLLSVAATLVDGRTYDITLWTAVGTGAGTPSNDTSFVRIREDTSTGTQLAQALVYIHTNSSVGYAVALRGQYTAVASGSKTFVVTCARVTGAAAPVTHQLKAAASRPTWLTVDLINP